MSEVILTVTAADCRWDYFRGSGNGGQKKQKTSSAVRCTHEPSGAMGQCSENRQQSLNKKIAFERMAKTLKFNMWVKRQVFNTLDVDAWIEEQMKPENIKIDYL